MSNYKPFLYFFFIGLLSTTLLETIYQISFENYISLFRAREVSQQEVNDNSFQFQLRNTLITLGWYVSIITFSLILAKTSNPESLNIKNKTFLRNRLLNFLVFLFGYLMVIVIVIARSITTDVPVTDKVYANIMTVYGLIPVDNDPILNTEEPFRLFIIQGLRGIVASVLPIVAWIGALFINENHKSEILSEQDSKLYPNNLK